MSIETAPVPTEGPCPTTHTPSPAAAAIAMNAKATAQALQPVPAPAQTYASDVLLGDDLALMGCDVEAWTAAQRPQFLAPPQPQQMQHQQVQQVVYPAPLTRHASLPASMMPYAMASPHHHMVPLTPQMQQAQPMAVPMLARHHSLGYLNVLQQQQAVASSPAVYQQYPAVVVAAAPRGEMQQMLEISLSHQQQAPPTPANGGFKPEAMAMTVASAPQQVNVEPIAFSAAGEAKLPLEDLDPLAFAVFDRPLPAELTQVESALDSLDRLLPEVEHELLFARGGPALDAFAQTTAPLLNGSFHGLAPLGKATPSSKSPKALAVCKVDGCDRRVRSKGFCKTHGGGRKCRIEGCKKSSQNGDFCIGHGGGKKCKEDGCAKAAQSHGLCKAHGGGARCKFPSCNKSSQGGGLCRAHGGGKRCQAQGCPKGAQRGNFCATHGGFRNCKIEGCVRTDRGGGFCEVHRRGRLCKVDGCKKLARNQGMCTMHIREVKQDELADGASAGSSSSDDDGVAAAVAKSLVV